MEGKSPHIMATSANLLGFTFIVLTSIRALGLAQRGITDEITGSCVILFALSTLTSFVSMRVVLHGRKVILETIADSIFLLGTSLCLILALLLVFDVVQLGK